MFSEGFEKHRKASKALTGLARHRKASKALKGCSRKVLLDE